VSRGPQQRDEAALGLGANLGPRRRTIQRAIALLREHPAVEVLAVSSIIETEPLGPPGQARYLNAAALVRTPLEPRALLGLCHEIEARLGRDRAREGRWGPRTIDLDILLHGDRVVDERDLRIPHAGLARRPFALIPLAEIADSWVHPELGVPIQCLLRAASAGAAER
jgi:2-amino-4-hydroxy-6-hydroxymethyldihydropteridine diphosphokinase